MSKALQVSVIAVYDEDTVTYWTLEGVKIGQIRGVEQVVDKVAEPTTDKVTGGVARALRPKEFKDSQEKRTNKIIEEIIDNR